MQGKKKGGFCLVSLVIYFIRWSCPPYIPYLKTQGSDGRDPPLTSQMQVCVLLGNGNVEWSVECIEFPVPFQTPSEVWQKQDMFYQLRKNLCRKPVNFAHWCVVLGENKNTENMTCFLECCCYVLEVLVLVSVHFQYYSTVIVVCSSKHKPLQIQGFNFVTENSLKLLITFSLFWKDLFLFSV